MARAKPPAKLTLPSGANVRLRISDDAKLGRPAHEPGAPLFAGAIEALEDDVRMTSREGKLDVTVDVGSLALSDFHVLRALVTKLGLVEEEEVVSSCRNCGAEIRVHPCAALEIGPWVDGELGDEELDATLPFGQPIDVPPLPIGRVRSAKSVTFDPRTVDQARPLFVALAQERLDVDPDLVHAMGVAALGKETDAERIADALASCDDESFAAVGRAFVATHYVPRLGCVVFCKACRARNDVDAPYDREFVEIAAPRESAPLAVKDDEAPGGAEVAFPHLDAFAARARDIARPMLVGPCAEVELTVDAGTPAVDDGGEPLLGSYLPPHPGDMSMPTRPPSVTIYYRTFHAIWDEEGAYDWAAELHETIEHELEHHVYFLRGEDPMDDEERAEIRGEAVRIIGRREAERRALASFGASVSDFVTRTWPLWVLAILALAAMLLTQR